MKQIILIVLTTSILIEITYSKLLECDEFHEPMINPRCWCDGRECNADEYCAIPSDINIPVSCRPRSEYVNTGLPIVRRRPTVKPPGICDGLSQIPISPDIYGCFSDNENK